MSVRAVCLLAAAVVLVCVVAPGPIVAQQDDETDDEYVELFDPEAEHPQEPPTIEPPMLEFDRGEDDEESREYHGDDEHARAKSAKAESERVPAADPGLAEPWPEAPRTNSGRLLEAGDSRDPRSVELFYYGCADEQRRRDVTLFANGTLRLRSGRLGAEDMQLEEIGPAELRRHVDRLLRIRAGHDFPDELQLRGSVAGRWIDVCRYTLDLPGFEQVSLDVGSFDVLPLPLRQLQQFADELAEFTRPLVKPESLTTAYQPKVGDALRTRSGHVFRVLGFTSDGRAAELERLDGERRIFVPLGEFIDYFVALEPNLGG